MTIILYLHFQHTNCSILLEFYHWYMRSLYSIFIKKRTLKKHPIPRIDIFYYNSFIVIICVIAVEGFFLEPLNSRENFKAPSLSCFFFPIYLLIHWFIYSKTALIQIKRHKQKKSSRSLGCVFLGTSLWLTYGGGVGKIGERRWKRVIKSGTRVPNKWK